MTGNEKEMETERGGEDRRRSQSTPAITFRRDRHTVGGVREGW